MDTKELEKLSGNIYKNLKVIDDYCAFNIYSEDADIIKPIVDYTMKIADKLYAIFINENNSKT